MRRSLFLCGLVASLEAEAAHLSSRTKPVAISKSAPENAGVPFDSFVSYSFELSSWPDFAGTFKLSSKTITAYLIIVSRRESLASK